MNASELQRCEVKPRGRIDKHDYLSGTIAAHFPDGVMRVNGDPANDRDVVTVRVDQKIQLFWS